MLPKPKILVCKMTECESYEEAVKIARRSPTDTRAVLESHSTSGTPPKFRIIWSVEEDLAKDLLQEALKSFPKLKEEDLYSQYQYHWYGSVYVLSVKRKARHMQKLKEWVKTKAEWHGLPIEFCKWRADHAAEMAERRRLIAERKAKEKDD